MATLFIVSHTCLLYSIIVSIYHSTAGHILALIIIQQIFFSFTTYFLWARYALKLKMKSEKLQCRSNYLSIFSSFHAAARLSHVQNKWIGLNVWTELMRGVTPHLDVVRKLTKDKFKQAILKHEYNLVSTNMIKVNENVYYYNESKITIPRKTKTKRRRIVT